jgi:diacylglycerol kinase (ATP)
VAQSTKLLPAALIGNPSAGSADGDDHFLDGVRALLRQAGIEARLYEAEEPEEIKAAAAQARDAGLELVIACGGDGTLEGVANELVRTPVTLGILPAGTRNNVAAGLNIPTDMPAAVALLRSGERRSIDMVHARCGAEERWFLEIFTAGLLATMFENAEAAQKGNLGALGDLVAKFVGATPAVLHLTVDDGSGKQTLQLETHAVLGMNMPYLGANFRVADDIVFDDGYLDLFLYDQLNKLDLLVHGLAVITDSDPDPRIRRLRVRHLALHADPPVPILVDGVTLGEGPVTMQVHQRVLRVITGLSDKA